jgi:hypothetical protein
MRQACEDQIVIRLRHGGSYLGGRRVNSGYGPEAPMAC